MGVTRYLTINGEIQAYRYDLAGQRISLTDLDGGIRTTTDDEIIVERTVERSKSLSLFDVAVSKKCSFINDKSLDSKQAFAACLERGKF